MLFKDLKAGNILYILDKGKVSVDKGIVNGITPPHVSTQPGVIGMFVDVSVSTGGDSHTYVVSDSGVTAYADNNNVVVTTDVNNVLAELRGIKVHCEDIVQNIDRYKENIGKCDILLSEYDPVFKKEQDNERRFTRLEDAVAQLAKNNAAQTESSNKIVELLSKLTKE